MTSRNNAFCAVIAAAGSGERMGNVSKPLIKLDGVTLLEYCLAAFEQSDVGCIVIVCNEKEKFLPFTEKCTKKVIFANGGKTRSESVFSGVSAVPSAYNGVIVHDCARPFVTPLMINEIIKAALEKGAASAATSVTDTIKYIDPKNAVLYTPNRDNLIAVQTPQAFFKKSYLAAFAKAVTENASFTDETSLLENAGYTVAYVNTGEYNQKLTTREDVITAKLRMKIKNKQESL